jgi:hypothetical protein
VTTTERKTAYEVLANLRKQVMNAYFDWKREPSTENEAKLDDAFKELRNALDDEIAEGR